MPLDRKTQREMLEYLATVYPRDVHMQDDFPDMVVNACYLMEHGLIAGRQEHLRTQAPMLYPMHITAAGLDFLADDGGLSAILGVVNVRVHADTIRELIAARVDAAEATPEEKNAIKRHLRNLPEAGLQEAIKALVREGLNRIPDVLSWLQTHAGL